MNSTNQFNLSLTDLVSFKPLVYARTQKGTPNYELQFIQVAIPVPGSGHYISNNPTIGIDHNNKQVILEVEVGGEGSDENAGHIVYFTHRGMHLLPKQTEDDFELVVLVCKMIDGRPSQLGKSVLKTVDEDE